MLQAFETVVMTTRVMTSYYPHKVTKTFQPTVLLICLILILCQSAKGQDVSLKVSTVMVEPYVMLHQGDQSVRYHGYIVDLLDRICQMLGLKYDLLPVEDGEYGQQGVDGTWNGMIRELLEKRAELAAAPLYVTDQRQEVIDFSLPFIIVQATVLILKMPSEPKNSDENARTTTDGSTDNQLTTSLEIKSVADLLNRPDYIFGTLNQGMLLRSFRSTNVTLYKAIYEKMKLSHPSVFTSTNEKGIDWVRQGYQATLADGPVPVGGQLKRTKFRRSRTLDQRGFFLHHSSRQAMNISQHHPHLHHRHHNCHHPLNVTAAKAPGPTEVVSSHQSLRSSPRGSPGRRHLPHDQHHTMFSKMQREDLNPDMTSLSSGSILMTSPDNASPATSLQPSAYSASSSSSSSSSSPHVRKLISGDFPKNKSTRSHHHSRAFHGSPRTHLHKDRRPNHSSTSQKSHHPPADHKHRIHYAFILPHTIGDYVSRQPPCDLIAVDRFLMREKFALAVPKGSGLLIQLNKALVKLKEEGYLDDLYSKWITDDSKCRTINSEPLVSEHQMLGDGGVHSVKSVPKTGDSRPDVGNSAAPSFGCIFTTAPLLTVLLGFVDS